MNKATLFLVSTGACVLAMASAIGKPAASSAPVEDSVNPDTIDGKNEATQAMLGYYVGPFSSNKITVRLEKLIGDTVTGYSVVQGNERGFTGSYKLLPTGEVDFQIREPGDSPTDGVFSLRLSTHDARLIGTWLPNNKRLAKVELALSKREFKYRANVGKYPQSSTKILRANDVSNMTQEELRIMRNEMYARHGYSFKLKDMQQHFDHEEWYMPLSTDVTAQLTPIEKKNHELIKRYENYSGEFYDKFGR